MGIDTSHYSTLKGPIASFLHITIDSSKKGRASKFSYIFILRQTQPVAPLFN